MLRSATHDARIRWALALGRLLTAPLTLRLFRGALRSQRVALRLLVAGALLLRAQTRHLLLLLDADALLFFLERLFALLATDTQAKVYECVRDKEGRGRGYPQPAVAWR